jgi:hypothetical protein
MLCRKIEMIEVHAAASIMGNRRDEQLAASMEVSRVSMVAGQLRTRRRYAWASGAAASCILLSHPIGAAGDDEAAATQQQSGLPNLNGEQLRAGGIVVAHPLATKTPARTEAVGVVLDATTLTADVGGMSAALVAEQSASAEAVRLRGLYSDGAGASLKMLEAAQAEQARAHAEAENASARFALHWSPLASLPSSERRRLIEACSAGRSLLLRADLPGQHTVGAVPRTALLDVDGIQVPGRVLGALRQSSEVQSVGLLIEVRNAPLGLGPGARVPVVLLTSPRSSLVVPRDSVLYDDKGAYVFKQLAKQSGDRKMRYAPVKVTLLAAYGDGWLIDGVDEDDEIVVRGAGVLWSLQGMGGRAVDDGDD